ncbi:MAG: hypothetical protein WAW06_12640 [bacterium]
MEDPAFLEALANPRLHSLSAVRTRTDECRAIGAKLDNAILSLPDSILRAPDPFIKNILTARLLTLEFELFTTEDSAACVRQTGGPLLVKMSPGLAHFDTTATLVAATESFQELAQRWNSWGLASPQGFVYIWITPDWKRLERELGFKPGVAASCRPCRYIAVVWRGNVADFRRTVKHELAHAFYFCSIGYARQPEVPEWWSEGCATYLTGDFAMNSVGTGQLSLADSAAARGRLQPDRQYVKAARCFAYIREEFGEDRLGAFVRRTIMEGAASKALWEVLGISNPATLLSRAEAYENTKARRANLVVLYYVGLVLLSLMVSRRRGLLAGSIALAAASVPLWFLSRVGHLKSETVFPAVSNWTIAGAAALLVVVLAERCFRRYRRWLGYPW